MRCSFCSMEVLVIQFNYSRLLNCKLLASQKVLDNFLLHSFTVINAIGVTTQKRKYGCIEYPALPITERLALLNKEHFIISIRSYGDVLQGNFDLILIKLKNVQFFERNNRLNPKVCTPYFIQNIVQYPWTRNTSRVYKWHENINLENILLSGDKMIFLRVFVEGFNVTYVTCSDKVSFFFFNSNIRRFFQGMSLIPYNNTNFSRRLTVIINRMVPLIIIKTCGRYIHSILLIISSQSSHTSSYHQHAHYQMIRDSALLIYFFTKYYAIK